jgi:NAD(P)-dependent dehydrogenase (short-subunit alcohol dehydrogenase family)
MHDFGAFYAATFDSLCVQLYAHSGDLAEAQDVVQEAFCRALSRWRTLSRYEDPQAWVRKVAWNLATSRWRRVKTAMSFASRYGEQSFDEPDPTWLDLRDALAKLPSRQRQALVLHYVADLGVLINNAAANFPVPAEDMSPNAWRTVVDITLNGTFNCSRELGRRHIAAGTPGAIVNIAASYAWTGGPGFAHSAAAKAGVKNLTESLAVEWGPYGIQVNALVPGLFPHEDMTADIQGNLSRTSDKDACQPALRVGQRQELGWAATFLASPYARFISGHTMVVDGANWQRRSLTNPPVVTIREQMGKGPFEA